jgi:hypothetical protein
MGENASKRLHELQQEGASCRALAKAARIAAQNQRQMIRAETLRLEEMVAEAERMLEGARL